MKRLIFLIMAIAVSVAVFADDAAQRALRRHIAEGNKAYSEKRYSDAEAAYKKGDPKVALLFIHSNVADQKS